MPVEQRVEPSDPFDVLRWTGDNLDEIAEFTALTPQVISGVLSLDLRPNGGNVVLLLKGWWVRRDADGTLSVVGERVAARWLTPPAA